MNTMNKILILLFCLLTHFCAAQVTFDPGAANVYNKVVQQLPAEYQEGIKSLTREANGMGGVCIYTTNHTDSLNKQDLIPEGAKVILTDPSTHQVINEEIKDEGLNIPVPCIVALKGDTLIITAPPLGPGSTHKLIRGKLSGTYQEYEIGNKIFRLSLSQSKTDYLNIPVKTSRFKISASTFKPGQIIYGEVAYITDSYYIDSEDFKSGYIHKRVHGSYVFKAIIMDLAKPPVK